MKKHFYLSLLILLNVYFIQFSYAINPSPLPKQVDIQNAPHIIDVDGIPSMEIEELRQIRNPANIALYALAYGGYEDYYHLGTQNNNDKFKNCVDWLVENLSQSQTKPRGWVYNFDQVYNDIIMKKPWYSAFGQAVGIESLLAAYDKFNEPKYLENAMKAAEILFIPLQEGGLLFESNGDIWFEEIPSSSENPSHILNGHMRALIAIKKLADLTGDKKYQDYFNKGTDTLIKWLPLFDTGYWLRYDLNPKKFELGFRFNNPYGTTLAQIPVHKIILKDPISGKESIINVGDSNDAEGYLRIAGNDWGQPEEIDNKIVRRLMAVSPASYQQQLDGTVHHSPGTYFYLNLPGEWKNNLRLEWFELIVVYKDIEAANLSLQMRSIAPGPAFQWMKDGNLLLTGSGTWREWLIPLRVSDLGFYCGEPYGEKHIEYLRILAEWEPKLKLWFNLMQGYRNTFDNTHNLKTVNLKKQILPTQYVLMPLRTIDNNGVIQQIASSSQSIFCHDGSWDFISNFGAPVYQMYTIADQAIGIFNHNAYVSEKIIKKNPYIQQKKDLKFITAENASKLVKRAPAYKYLLDHAEEKSHNALLWNSYFHNAYNDVTIQEGWSSAFTQAYVIKALKAAIDDKITDPKANYQEILVKALNGYFVPVSENGLLLQTLHNLPFFQEFSQFPHSILNAHLISLTTIKEFLHYNPKLTNLYQDGFKTLKEHFNMFDTGYWLRYDLNPKKEILCQIDWLEGEKSPLIESISLENPQTQEQTFIAVNEKSAFNSYPYITGLDWSSVEVDNDTKGRSFLNGYKIRSQPVQGGAVHNVYFMMSLPTRIFNNDFTIPAFKLRIRYKDVAQGKFQLKIKPVNMNDHHNFIPFQESHLVCNGDQKWKEAVFIIYPKDLGWFVGVDYQQFHTEQLKLLGEQNDDWFFKQQAERQLYFLNSFKKNLSINLRP